MKQKKHRQHIEEVPNLLNNAGMTINLKKCSFLSWTVDAPGNVIAPGIPYVATKTTEAMKDLHYPTTVLKLR